MIEHLAKHIFETLEETGAKLSSVHDSGHIKAIIEARLRALNLVTREEFDAQQAVLSRSREKIDALEKTIDELQNRLASAQASAAPRG